MKRLSKKETPPTIDPVALQVWEDVVYSMDQYTHDSVLSKFFLPEELTHYCRATATVFAQLHYSPIPSKEDISRSRLFALFYLAMMCGAQTFLKERAIFTHYAPYAIRTNKKEIREIKNKILRQIEEGVEVFSPFDQVMALFLNQLLPVKQKVTHSTKEGEFNQELFDKFLPISLMWGYLFAKEMVYEEN